MENLKCPKCNTEIENANNFCSNCGYQLNSNAIDIQNCSCTIKSIQAKKKKTILMIGILGSILIIGLLAFFIPKITAIYKMETIYKNATCYLDNNEFLNAISEFQKLDNYKDSNIKVKEAYYKLANREYVSGNLETAIDHYYAAGNYHDASEKYTIATYEYGKQLVSKWDYINGAEQFDKIDYKDSKELALLYSEFDRDRCHNNKFYYYAEEFEYKLNTLLQEENKNYSAIIDDDNITNTPVIYIYDNENFTGICISLCEYNKKGTFNAIDIRWLNVSESKNNYGTATYIYTIFLADPSMTIEQANNYYMELLDAATNNALWGNIYYTNTIKDIEYSFWYSLENDESGLLISSPHE